MHLTLYVCIATGTLVVMIRLHKQADLMGTKVDHTEDKKLALGKN